MCEEEHINETITKELSNLFCCFENIDEVKLRSYKAR